MRSAWDILEIAPTDDLSVIKKAYSKKLKIYHPEDDPEGYQMLREAYDYLSKEIKKRKKHSKHSGRAESAAAFEAQPVFPEFEEASKEEEEEISPISSFVTMPYNLETEEEETLGPIHPYVSMPVNQGTSYEPKTALAEFLQKAEALYHHFHERIDETKWMELLDHDILWDIELKHIASRKLLSFIEEHSVLPKKIWLLLESQFHWLEVLHEEAETSSIENDFLPYYESRIRLFPALSFDFAAKAEGFDYDRFLTAREAALAALLTDDLETAQLQITVARALFTDDPDLLRIQAHVFYRLGLLKEALEAMEEAASLQPGNFEETLFLARLLFVNKADERAEAICSTLLKKKPDNENVLSLYGKILFTLGKFENARIQFKHLQSLHPYDAEAITYLANIHKEMSAKSYQNAALSKKELRKELKQHSVIIKILLFLQRQLKRKIIISAFLFIFGWNGIREVSEDMQLHPVFTVLFSIFRPFPDRFTFYNMTMPVLVASIFMIFGARTILREWKRIMRSIP